MCVYVAYVALPTNISNNELFSACQVQPHYYYYYYCCCCYYYYCYYYLLVLAVVGIIVVILIRIIKILIVVMAAQLVRYSHMSAANPEQSEPSKSALDLQDGGENSPKLGVPFKGVL